MGFDLFGRNQKSPKGEYFRSNVWWWRPLAEYVYNHTNCVDKKDVQAWAHNDGHEVSEAEAEAIAKQLQHLISTGHTKRYAEQYEAERKALEKHNEKIKKRLKKLEDKFPNLAPNEYHPIYKKKWDEIYDQKKWGAHYPFSVNHVAEFAEFCKESGGFKIC